MDITSFGIANFRSFDDAGVILERPGKINIIIGKNNSGKSNVLRFFRRLAGFDGNSRSWTFDPVVDSHRRDGKSSRVIFGFDPRKMTDDRDALNGLADAGIESLSIELSLPRASADKETRLIAVERWQLYQFWKSLHPQGGWNSTPSVKSLESDLRNTFAAQLTHMLVDWGEKVMFVPDFRRILSNADEPNNREISGQNIIKLLHEMQHPKAGAEDKQEQYAQIEEMIRSLLQVDRMKMEIDHESQTIILNMHGNRLPLESFGTGIHQLVIFCAAFALYEGKIFCIEEPELHLHPELQRRFLRFINDTKNTYYITTHSSVFLDSAIPVSVYHVEYDGTKSVMQSVDTSHKARNVLSDLGYKASDLLQSNAVIWVEGPSDRVYLNKWISLVAPDLVERLHYSIMFYGGKTLSHMTCEAEEPVDELVSLLHINRNSAVVMDRDGETSKAALSRAKKRVKGEIGEKLCWITQGREIENYLRGETVAKYLSRKYGVEVRSTPIGKDEKINAAIKRAARAAGKKGFTYSDDKVGHSRGIAELMTADDLNVRDLRRRIEGLVEQIRLWNHAPVTVLT
jgi:predicted ATP-dependent endonuclease of OLD family